jgi:hypothetical protein
MVIGRRSRHEAWEPSGPERASPRCVPVSKRGPIPYLRAEALRSLVAIEGAEPLRLWLLGLAEQAPLMVQTIDCAPASSDISDNAR